MPCTKGQRILEVGCGTGAFTKAILKNLKQGDEFHIVELNPVFCSEVEASLIEPFREGNPSITIVIHQLPIEQAVLEGKFDAIICGLPFNNFPVPMVNGLFEVIFGLLADDCKLVYFEYLGMRVLKSIFGSPSIRRNTKERTADINSRFQLHGGSQQNLWRNIPPCRVIRLCK